MPSKPRITLVVGAGASMEAGIPGVASLTRRLDCAVRADAWIVQKKGDAALEAIVEQLAGLFDNSSEVHFERIYHVANRLMQHARDPKKAAPEFRPLLQPFFSPFPSTCSEDSLRALQQGYLKHIFRIITGASSGADIVDLRKFIGALRSQFIVRIYTLNYDNLIFQAHPDLFTGFSCAFVDDRRHAHRFDRAAFFKRQKADALFHLHGSIHFGYQTPSSGNFAELFWFDNPEEVLKSADDGSGRGQADGTFIERSPLITGYEKSTSVLALPFSFYYSEFLRDLMVSETIMLVGYGLGDPHINELVAASRGSSRPPKLLAVDNFDWKDVLHSSSLKGNQYAHLLGIPISDNQTMSEIVGTPWRASKELGCAVYAGGFGHFMRETTDPTTLIRSVLADKQMKPRG